MKHYQFVFAGGGMAALSLAYRLVTGEYPDARILIVDPEQKGENDRTWSFWSCRNELFDPVVHRRWRTLTFRSSSFEADIDMSPYDYRTIRGEDFYSHVITELERHRGVEFERGEAKGIAETAGAAVVELSSGTVSAEWVFDSRFVPQDYQAWEEMHAGQPLHFLKQHFLGWVVETREPRFADDRLTMFDFRIPQDDQMRFMYVLPYAGNRALVEYTLFGAKLLGDEEYVAPLERYIRDVLGLDEYRVVEREKGVIPMTDLPFARRVGERVMTIGTRAGCVKPTTGYAFLRTQRDSEAIVQSLSGHGHPFDVPSMGAFTRARDSMLLQIMHRRSELAEEVFSRLFSRNPIDRLFRFLDDESTIPEVLQVMATVPWWPFIQALIKTRIVRKV